MRMQTLLGNFGDGRTRGYAPLFLMVLATLVSSGCAGVAGSKNLTAPPAPVTLSNPIASNISGVAATVSWTTNVAANSQVDYGTTVSYSQSTPIDPSMVTTHTVNLSGLTSSTLYHYRVKSRDAAGNLATSVDFTFSTASSGTGPSVSITAPGSGATVSGTVTVIAATSAEVVGVQFKLDGANLGVEVTASPYLISWDTTAVANGAHTLSARARDAAGNTATSAGVSVTVNNGSGNIVRVGPNDPWCDTINSVSPGTTVILISGSYSTPCWIRAQGTAAAPIVIRSESSEPAARAVLNYAGTSANITELVGATYVTLRWLSFGPSQDGVDGIRIQTGVHDIVIEENLFQGLGGVSIPANSADTQRIAVRGNTFKNLKSTAMYFGCHEGTACHATEILIEGNLIDGVMPTDGVSVGYGMEIKLNSVATVRDNTIYRTKGPSITVYGSNRGDPPSVVEGNYVESSQTDAGINVSGGPAIVRNNVSVGNANGGIWAQDYNGRNLQQNVWIVHNTALRNSSAGILVQNWQAGRGNVIAYNAVLPASGTSAILPASPAGTLMGNTTCDASCFDQATTAPYDLWPAIASPLLGAAGSGTEPWRPSDDFMGTSRGNAADVGAFQRTGPGGGPPLGGGNPRPKRLGAVTRTQGTGGSVSAWPQNAANTATTGAMAVLLITRLGNGNATQGGIQDGRRHPTIKGVDQGNAAILRFRLQFVPLCRGHVTCWRDYFARYGHSFRLSSGAETHELSHAQAGWG